MAKKVRSRANTVPSASQAVQRQALPESTSFSDLNIPLIAGISVAVILVLGVLYYVFYGKAPAFLNQGSSTPATLSSSNTGTKQTTTLAAVARSLNFSLVVGILVGSIFLLIIAYFVLSAYRREQMEKQKAEIRKGKNTIKFFRTIPDTIRSWWLSKKKTPKARRLSEIPEEFRDDFEVELQRLGNIAKQKKFLEEVDKVYNEAQAAAFVRGAGAYAEEKAKELAKDMDEKEARKFVEQATKFAQEEARHLQEAADKTRNENEAKSFLDSMGAYAEGEAEKKRKEAFLKAEKKANEAKAEEFLNQMQRYVDEQLETPRNRTLKDAGNIGFKLALSRRSRAENKSLRKVFIAFKEWNKNSKGLKHWTEFFSPEDLEFYNKFSKNRSYRAYFS